MPYQKWVTENSYIWKYEGWLYLAVILVFIPAKSLADGLVHDGQVGLRYLVYLAMTAEITQRLDCPFGSGVAMESWNHRFKVEVNQLRYSFNY